MKFAGRAYEVYGGVYVVASIAWLWIAKGQISTRRDIMGGLFCLTSMAIIMIAPMFAK